MNSHDREELLALPLQDRLLLVMELWDSIADEATAFPVEPALLAKVEQRVASYLGNPGDVHAWEDVRSDLARRFLTRDGS